MQVLNIFYVLIAIAMVALILVQKGAGATAGAAFGSGASGTVFGSRGAGNFLTRTTWVLATLFCAISLLMAVLVSRMSNSPEVDLGVLSSAPAATESVDANISDSALTIPEESDGSDVPVLNVSSDDQSQESITVEAAEDLPSIDEADVATPVGDQSDPASGEQPNGS